MTTWWLIRDEDVEPIRRMLEAGRERVDDKCGNDGCLCTFKGNVPCSQPYTDAIHRLDSGLHRTDAVPADEVGANTASDRRT